MSQSTNDERCLDSPKRSESIQSDCQIQLRKLPITDAPFLGKSIRSNNVTISKKYIDSQTHGVQLYYQEYNPTNINAQIVIVHGFGEHSGNYEHLAESFVNHEFKVILYDQRGFGYSGGRRAHAVVEEMHMDLDTILQQIDRSIPLFIYCHALGAALVFSFCLMNPTLNFQGIISSSAQLRIPAKYGKLKMLFLRMMVGICPDLQVNTYQNFSYASKNNFHMKKLSTDPLLWPFMSIQFAYNILLFQQFIFRKANQFKIPILLLHGKEDRVASHIDSLDFYKAVSSKEKTLKIFEAGFHELQNDSEWPKMKIIMIQWCKKMMNKDMKVSFMREHNYGVKIQRANSNNLRIILIIIFLVLRNKLKCLRWPSKISLVLLCEILIRFMQRK